MGKKRETKPLLDKSGTAATTSTSIPSTSGSVPKKAPKSKPGTSSTLTKPTLASVHEQASLESPSADPAAVAAAQPQPQPPTPTPSEQRFFGVRTYLHHFYDPVPTSSPGGAGGGGSYHYLIRPKEAGPTGCAPVFFKIGLSVGATLFLLGSMAIIIGYAIPRQPELRGQTAEYKIIDRNAIAFNRNLDMCKLVGLAGFCAGGIVLVAALLTPTFANSYWDENITTEPFRLALAEDQELSDSCVDDDGAESAGAGGPKSPGLPVPVTEKIRCIQPVLTEEYEVEKGTK